MKIIYRAADGEIFETEEECLNHEKHNLAFMMWDENGRTEDMDAAVLIEVHDEDRFQEMVSKEDNTTEGVDGTGLYIWDNECICYVKLSEKVQSALQHYLTLE